MVEVLYHIAINAYHFAVTGVLWPVITWSLLALLVMGGLHRLGNRFASVQFYTRFFTLLALPVGIVLYNAVNVTTTQAAQFSAGGSMLRLVVYPSIQTAAADPAHSQSTFGSFPFAAGAVLLLMLLISVLAVIRIFFTMGRIQQHLARIPIFNFHNSRHIDRDIKHKLECFPRPISVKVSDQYHIPFTSGWRNPVIVVPETLMVSPQKLNMTLQHELHHIQRNDFIINLFTQLIRALFFFHPLLHRLARHTVDFMEISCDQQVIIQNRLSRKQYAHLLYDFWPFITSYPAATIRMACSSSNLKRRIKAMEHTNRNIESPKTIWTAALSCLLTISMITACSQVNEPESNNNQPQTADKATYKVVETMPKLKGGLQSLMSEIQYPKEAKESGTEGRVLVQFVVTPEGSVRDAKVIHSASEELDREALRVAKQAKFKPGTQNGEVVPVQMSIPIVFRLDNSDGSSDNDSKTSRVELQEITPDKVNDPVIRGLILDADTERPIQAANITLAETRKGAASHSDGTFRIMGLDSGNEYTIQINHPDYEFFKTSVPADPGLRAKIYLQKK